jgi:hypothetical protein
MIQPLRTIHRRMFIVLAAVLPVILGAGLKVRHHAPLAKADTSTSKQVSNRLNQATAAWAKKTFDAKIYSEPVKPRAVQIILRPLRGLDDEPDLLLYWTSQAATDSRDLTDAHLLGPFRPAKSYSVPTGNKPFSLVLYSLGHHEIVDTARVEVLP